MIKVLNLYACLGGNRLKWNDCKVTAVELDPDLAELYKKRFPDDDVIISDAHNFLLHNYNKFDFIWSSPPCPKNSRARYWRRKTTTPCYPDLTLYEEIIFLNKWFKGLYCVENVIPYYEPLIPAQKRGRHLYWTNFNLPENLNERKLTIMVGKNEVARWCDFHEFDFNQYKGSQRIDKIARNLVDYEAGLTIYNEAKKIIQCITL